MMAKGPSPLIPLLLVITLGLFLRGNSFPLNLNVLPSISEAENAVFLCFACIPLLVLLAIYSTSHAILLPLAIVLAMYTVTTMLLGPLVLVLIVYLVSVNLLAFKCNGEELGWGVLLVLVFVTLQWVLSEEGRQSGVLVLAVVVLICYSFSS